MSSTYTATDAAAYERLMGRWSPLLADALIAGPSLLPQFPSEQVDALTAGQIRQGRDFRVSPFRVRGDVRYVKAVAPDGELVAIGEARLPHLYHPIVVL